MKTSATQELAPCQMERGCEGSSTPPPLLPTSSSSAPAWYQAVREVRADEPDELPPHSPALMSASLQGWPSTESWGLWRLPSQLPLTRL